MTEVRRHASILMFLRSDGGDGLSHCGCQSCPASEDEAQLRVHRAKQTA